MSLPYLDHIRMVSESLPHCHKLGIIISQLEQGKGRIELSPRAELIGNHARNFIHSGVVTTLLDTLFGAVAASVYPEGRTVATLDLRIDHLKAMEGDHILYGKAECYHFNDDLAYVRGWAWQEDESELVASSVATLMVGGAFNLKRKAV